MKSRVLPLVSLFALACMLAAVVTAQPRQHPSQINRPIDNNRRTLLSGHVHARAIAANDEGPVARDFEVPFVTITFAPTAAQQAELDQLLVEQQTAGSPNYHRWLTPEDYASRFGLSDDDVAKVTTWAESQGLTVAQVARSRAWIAVSGTASRVEAAFRTELHNYRVNGETRFANATEPSVPEAMGGVVRGIRGLNNFRLQKRAVKSTKPRLDPQYTSSRGNHYLAPDDVATIYNIKPLLDAGFDGTGQKLVIAGQTQLDLADYRLFRSNFNLPANDPQMILVPGARDPGVSSDDVPEANLDIEWSSAVARNATIYYVYSYDVMDAVLYTIDQNLAPVVSTSYGLCELEFPRSEVLAMRTWAKQGNAQGITWFSASGDAGAADCGNSRHPGLAVDTPASIPEVTAVGGTSFNEGSGTYWGSNSANRGSALSYIPEKVWNDSALDGEPSGSGGGSSIYFLNPAWQVGAGFPDDSARHLPDIAMSASADHDGYLVYNGGQQEVYGGTSVPTPVMAGVAAVMNQFLVARGAQSAPGLGNMNPGFYALAKSSPDIFHDITEGDNIVTVSCGTRVNCTPAAVGYKAASGYDLATGLGSFDVSRLAAAWGGVAPVSSTNISLLTSVRNLASSEVTYLTATLTGNGSTPSGTVAFSAGSTQLGSAALVGSAGVATATLAVTGAQLPIGDSTITATYNASSPGTASATVGLTVSSTGSGTGNVPTIGGFANGASFKQTFAPGMILSVFGTQLAPSIGVAGAVPLPYSLAGVAVTINGVAAPLYYVSPSQINLQIPYDVPANSGVNISINNNGRVSSKTLAIGAIAPGIFTDATTRQVPYPAASRGQSIALFVTGVGAVSPAVATGAAPATTTTLSNLPRPIGDTHVTIGGVEASIQFVGIPYGLAGVAQINYQVPGGVGTGVQPVVVTVGGVQSAAATVLITN